MIAWFVDRCRTCASGVFLLGAVLVCSLWRAYPTIAALRKRDVFGAGCQAGKAGGRRAVWDWCLVKQVVMVRSPRPTPSLQARKDVAKQFALLLVDLIALPFAVVNVFSWRVTSYLPALLTSGDFYNMFALTTFLEFGKFLVDLPVLVLVLVRDTVVVQSTLVVLGQYQYSVLW